MNSSKRSETLFAPGILCSQNHCRITGTGAHGRSGDALLSPPHRTRSSRYRRISSGTCIPRGGWLSRPGGGAVRRMRRCGLSRHQFPVYHWMFAVRLWAFVHQSYGCCTIITHMRINHLKDRYLTQSITALQKKYSNNPGPVTFRRNPNLSNPASDTSGYS